MIDPDEAHADVIWQRFATELSGAQDGDVLVGTHPGNRGASVRLHFEKTQHPFIRPYRKRVDLMLADVTRKHTYDQRMRQMNAQLSLEWIEKHADGHEGHWHEVPGLQLEWLQFSSTANHITTRIDAAVLNEWMRRSRSPPYVSPVEVFHAFPRKPGSHARYHTLIGLKSFWKVVQQYRVLAEPIGYSIRTMESGNDNGHWYAFADIVTRYERKQTKRSETYLPVRGSFDDPSTCLSIFVPSALPSALPSAPPSAPSCTTADALISDLADILSPDVASELVRILSTWTPSWLKSLLQKLIRFAPDRVDLLNGGEAVDASAVVAVVIATLVCHPGTFVPDIQRFVTGAESTAKRLVVSIVEDACLLPLATMSERLRPVLASAYVAQRVSGWKPTVPMVRSWIQLACEAMRTHATLPYDIARGKTRPKLTWFTQIPKIAVRDLSVLMDDLKSFEGDLAMFRDWAYLDDPIPVAGIPLPTVTIVMRLDHCIDQHCAPDWIYMLPAEALSRVATASGFRCAPWPRVVPGTYPFSEWMHAMWTHKTGVNRRKQAVPTHALADVLGDAQRAWYERKKQVKEQKMENVVEKEEFESQRPSESSLRSRDDFETYVETYELHDGWLANWIGVAEVEMPDAALSARSMAMVTLRPDRLDEYAVMRRPTRTFVTDDMRTSGKRKRNEYAGQPDSYENPTASSSLTPEQEAYVKQQMEQRLTSEHGVLCKNVSAALRRAMGITVKSPLWVRKISEGFLLGHDRSLDDEKEGGTLTWVPWNTVSTISCTTTPRDVNWLIRDSTNLSGMSKMTIQRILSYSDAWNHSWTMRPMSRDGGGTDQPVSIHDVYAFHWFDRLRRRFPDSFVNKPGSTLHIEVREPVRWWLVRRWLQQRLSSAPEISQLSADSHAAPSIQSFLGGGSLSKSLPGAFAGALSKSLPGAFAGALPKSLPGAFAGALSKSLPGAFAGALSSSWPVLTDRKQRTPWPHQTHALEKMMERDKAGHNGQLIWIPPGKGKTWLVMSFLRYLQQNTRSAAETRHVFYTAPSSAMKSILDEIECFFPVTHVHFFVPLAAATIKKHQFAARVVPLTTATFQRYRCGHLFLIEHDHVRKCMSNDVFIEQLMRAVWITDEAHKAMNDTLRTQACLQAAEMAPRWVAMTGTWVMDHRVEKMTRWLQHITPFTIHPETFWVAANGIVAEQTHLPIRVQRSIITLDWTAPYLPVALYESYRQHTPIAMGGTQTRVRLEDLHVAAQICFEATLRGIVERIVFWTQEQRTSVMVVVDRLSRQEQLVQLLANDDRTRQWTVGKDIACIHSQNTINFTDETVREGQCPDYKVIIVPQAFSMGYNLTRSHVMITGVYPSNHATRSQLEGRQNRMGQTSDHVVIETVQIGLLCGWGDRHAHTRRLEGWLSQWLDPS